MAKLSTSEIEAILAEHIEWRLEGGALVRVWTFRDFVEAILFVNRVAALAMRQITIQTSISATTRCVFPWFRTTKVELPTGMPR